MDSSPASPTSYGPGSVSNRGREPPNSRASAASIGIDRERRDRSAKMGRQSTAEIEDLETDAAMNYVEQVIGAA